MKYYSVIIPCFNGEKYIDKCINSLLCQSYQNFEIIVIDDGSNDKSIEILESYQDKIKLIKQNHLGVSVARNTGIENAKGDYFLFVDIDDYVSTDLIKTIDEKCNDADMIKYWVDYVYDDHVRSEMTNYPDMVLDGHSALYTLIDSKIPFDMTPTWAYKKSYWDYHNFAFEENRYHEDFGCLPKVIYEAKKVILLNDILYHYYQSSNSITRDENSESKMKKAMDVLYFYNKYRKEYEDEKLMSYMANAVLNQYEKLKGENKKKYRQEIRNVKLYESLMDDTLIRKLKKIYYKLL